MDALNTPLKELELLKVFKELCVETGKLGNSSPFEAKVATHHQVTNQASFDIADLQMEIRRRLNETIEDVRSGRKGSQVILISGGPGTGKTHLLNTYRNPELQQNLGYIFMGGSNHWKISEFEGRLLDWVIEALTAPAPTEDHPLLQRIRTIGFRAIEILLETPGYQLYLQSSKNWFRKKIFGRVSSTTLKQLCQSHDPALFNYFDEQRLGDYIASRFLAERSNPIHRYVMKILVSYLFNNEGDLISERDHVLHWFRGTNPDQYFKSRFGITEELSQDYTRTEAVKLLAHLFSGEVSRQLGSETQPCEPITFLLTFDQTEGRAELFESELEWREFFAQLSELYNSMSNLVIVFTMTNLLRDRYLGTLERQFRDRMIATSDFELRLPNPEQLLNLYRRRCEGWLAHDPIVLDKYRSLANPFLPFTIDSVKLEAGNKPIRLSLEILHKKFLEKLQQKTFEPLHDYRFFLNQLNQDNEVIKSYDYTSKHLDTLKSLMDRLNNYLKLQHNIFLTDITQINLDSIPCLQLTMELSSGSRSIQVNIARFGRNYTSEVPRIIDQLLKNAHKNQNFLWLLRPEPWNPDIPHNYSSQIFAHSCKIEIEQIFLSLIHVADKAAEVAENDPAYVTAFEQLLQTTIDQTYLGELLKHSQEKLKQRVKTDAGSEVTDSEATS
ncbi:MAG: ATP-binding protein [Zavarzinella sp.]